MIPNDDWTPAEIADALARVYRRLRRFCQNAIDSPPSEDREQRLADLMRIALPYLPDEEDQPAGRYTQPAPGWHPTYGLLTCVDCGATWVGEIAGEDCAYCERAR